MTLAATVCTQHPAIYPYFLSAGSLVPSEQGLLCSGGASAPRWAFRAPGSSVVLLVPQAGWTWAARSGSAGLPGHSHPLGFPVVHMLLWVGVMPQTKGGSPSTDVLLMSVCVCGQVSTSGWWGRGDSFMVSLRFLPVT